MSRLSSALSESWRRHRGLLLPAWIVGLVVCLFMGWAGSGLYFYLDFRDNGRRFAGIMSLASGFLLIGFGWSLLLLARRALRRGGWNAESLGWTVAGTAGVWLAFDEVAKLHETATHYLVRIGVPRLFGVLDQDVYIFAAYGIVAVSVAWLLRKALQRRTDAWLPILVAVVFLFLSQCVDEIPYDSMSHATQQWVGAIEEILKVMGTFSLALFGFVLADDDPR